jgi:hypothetical protein
MSGLKLKYSESDMAALISEVETQFADHLKKAESAQENLHNSEAATPVEKIETPESEPSFDYNEEDIATMNDLYGSMAKAEAEAHYSAVKKALFGETGDIQKSESSSESQLLKSELEAKEAEIVEVKKSRDELQKSMDKLIATLTNSVTKSIEAPKQKAITKIEFVAKSEEDNAELKKTEGKQDVSKLTKSEISSQLSTKIRTGKIEKADREKINNFYLGEGRDLESIKHLL